MANKYNEKEQNMEDVDFYKNGNVDRYMILKCNASENRSHPTEAERYLWEFIRRKALGVKFIRQHPILDFIADFTCLEKKLVIEVDGGYHNDPQQQEYDRIRSNRLQNMGYIVLRFTNEEVLNNISHVISTIRNTIEKL